MITWSGKNRSFHGQNTVKTVILTMKPRPAHAASPQCASSPFVTGRHPDRRSRADFLFPIRPSFLDRRFGSASSGLMVGRAVLANHPGHYPETSGIQFSIDNTR